MAHTPGPWTAKMMDAPGRQWHGQWEIHWSSDGECVAEIVWKADDAQLIAAAPDLLAACEVAIAAYDLAKTEGTSTWRGREVDEMRAAIAKAKGQS